jgi:hypothetical protein
MRALLIATMASALAGCMMETEAAPPAPGAPQGECNAAKAEAFIGRAGAAVAEQARAAAGAKDVRVIGPDQAVTMDFRPDRLNLETDADGKVLKVRCG